MKRLISIALIIIFTLPSWAPAATSITKRAEKGAALTWSEMDQNLENLRTGLDNHVASTSQAIAALQAGQAGGIFGFETKSAMDADLNHPAGALAIVTNDADTSNNTTWIKLGSSGSGSWQKSTQAAPLPFVDARKYADFAAAVAAQGSTRAVLLVSTAMAVTADLDVPATLFVMFLPGGSLTVTSGRTVRLLGNQVIEPQWFGVVADGTTDCHIQLQQALNAVPTGGMLHIPAGSYVGYISVRRSNIAIHGDGSPVTTIKMPAGADTNVLELGDTASGNGAAEYTDISVAGIAVDGNKSAAGSPSGDLTGWGMPATKISKSRFSDLRAVNCLSGGFGFFINSNYNTGNGFYSEGTAGTAYASGMGFDINSSKHNSFSGIISSGDKYGVRILDNCWDNYLQADIYNPTASGLLYYNQTVNESHNNTVDVTVEGGCTAGNGVTIGANVRNSIINASVKGSLGYGLQIINQTDAYQPEGNIIRVATYSGQYDGVVVGGKNNDIDFMSYHDGRAGSQGTSNAVTVPGSLNRIKGKIIDTGTWQVRSISIASGATDNVFDVTRSDDYVLINDLGTRSKFIFDPGYGPDIPSAGAINIPWKGSVFNLTGTEGIAEITAGWKGREITLIVPSGITIYDDSVNLKLDGHLVSAGATLKLVSDGTYWRELSRSMNE